MPSPLGSFPLKRSALFILSAVALMVGMGDAQAWGFGRAQSSAVLGLPLDFSVALRLDPSEPAPECLSAEVSAGDIPVPRSAVYVSLEASPSGPAVRVRTTVAIDEPVVAVRLTAGCTSSASRRFTLFADPPGHLASAALPQAEAVQASTSPVATSPAPLPAPVPPAPPVAPLAPSAPTPAVEQPRAAAAVVAPAAPAAASGASPGPGTGRGVQASRPRGPESAVPLASADSMAGQQGTARAARPKLQLDAPTVLMQAPGAAQGAGPANALASAQEAASAARAAVSAAEARAADMQKSIEALRQEAQANREAVARLTQALADAQGSPPKGLWAALAALGGLCALLFVRLRRVQGPGAPAPWWTGGAAASIPGADQLNGSTAAQRVTEVPQTRGSAGVSETTTLPTLQPAATTLPVAPAAQAAVAQPSALPEPLQVAGVDAVAGAPIEFTSAAAFAALPSVSIDELLDLQQQVEFFLVLGQEDAALKLLVEHLRVTRGDCPLPHLQLMDMYRRRADQVAFEEARGRFQRQFGVACPDWVQGPQVPHPLEDAPGLLLDIERVWHDPAQAMQVLEALLRAADRTDSLQPTVQSDLLFLFTLARDLHDQPAPAPAPVTGAAAVSPAWAAATPPAAASLSPVERSGEVDFDLDLDMPQGNEPDLDLPLDMALPASSAGLADFPRVGATVQPLQPVQPVQALPVIDLPLVGAEGSVSGTAAAAAAALSARAVSNEGVLDLTLDEPLHQDLAPAQPAVVKPALVQAGQALSLEFPDLELSGSARPHGAAAVTEVDLELSFDELDVAELPAPLSAGEERAASRFSLFSEEFGPAKKR